MEETGPSPTGYNIDLESLSNQQEITLTLTLGQLNLINEFLGDLLQPRGYPMIAWAYDLFERLNQAIESVEPYEEAFLPGPHEGEMMNE